MYVIYKLSCSKMNLNELIDTFVLSTNINYKNEYKLVHDKKKKGQKKEPGMRLT